MKKKTFQRKDMLMGVAGACLALPRLELHAAKNKPVPKRMVAAANFYGFMPEHFFPKQSGKQYEMPELLKPLSRHRKDFTVFSGLDHDLSGGHEATRYLLSGIKMENSRAFAERNISIDQKAAQFVGAETRYPSLALDCLCGPSNQISWSATGAMLPTIKSLTQLYNLLFRNLSPVEIKKKRSDFDERTSILDLVRVQSKQYEIRLGQADKQRMEQYYSSVRDLELKIQQSEAWLSRKKPFTDYKLKGETDQLDLKDQIPLFYDLIRLALQTDSTRVVTLSFQDLGKNYGGISGVGHDYHSLSHHGKVDESIRELMLIEKTFTSTFSGFLDKMKEVIEPNGETLLGNTMCLLGCGMSNGNSHSNKNLPILLAGGGFKHGEHKVYDKVGGKSVPLNNLYLNMLQNFGLELDQFNTSTSTLRNFS